MNRHLNYYLPYGNNNASHENQITRALLSLMRLSPVIHQAVLYLINQSLQVHQLPQARFDMQCKYLLAPGFSCDDEIREIDGISVFLSPEGSSDRSAVSDDARGQVIDGVIQYGLDLIIAIENKVYPNRSAEQAFKINLHGAPVKFRSEFKDVKWPDVIAAIVNVYEKEMLGATERVLVEDFLDLVDEYFPKIGPYSCLANCQRNEHRIMKRLDTIMEIATQQKDEGARSLGWRSLDVNPNFKVKMAELGYDANVHEIYLKMWPGDTMAQAKNLYANESCINNVLALKLDGDWEILPNLHWGFIGSGAVWMESPADLDAYCAYWIRQREDNQIGQKQRHEWEGYWTQLIDDGIAPIAKKTDFDAYFTNTNRQTAQIRPGLSCMYTWKLDEAIKLDSNDKFSNSVRRKINEVMNALGEPIIISEI